MSSINKLTSLSTQTLSLILERQRFPHAAATHDERIQGNMQALRDGIRELGSGTEVNGLRQQYERMRGMVGGPTSVSLLFSIPYELIMFAVSKMKENYRHRQRHASLKSRSTHRIRMTRTQI